jgi:LysM domain/Transglycosylase-like domain
MSRRPAARHAKVVSRYDGRHIKPGTPGPAALVGTAAKAVPASLAVGAASSALVISGAASAATIAPAAGAHGGATELGAVRTAAALHAAVYRGRHAKSDSYTVISGDTLSKISARFCGTPADFQSLAAASGISNPNVIYVGQSVRIRCHAAVTASAHPASGGDGDGDGDGRASGAVSRSSSRSRAAHRAPARHAHTVSSRGMSAFEACVISRESGGNPRAVNPSSGAGGLFQFLPSTWASLGYAAAYPGGAQTAPVSVQKAAFAKLYAEAGTSPWAPYDGC